MEIARKDEEGEQLENIADLVWYPGLRVIAEADFHPHLSFLLI